MKFLERCAVTNYVDGLGLDYNSELAGKNAKRYAFAMSRNNKLPKICRQHEGDCLIKFYAKRTDEDLRLLYLEYLDQLEALKKLEGFE
jgi:hypothetical protein